MLRVPCIVPDTGKRTLPRAEPLVRNEALLGALDPTERAALERFPLRWNRARRSSLAPSAR